MPQRHQMAFKAPIVGNVLANPPAYQNRAACSPVRAQIGTEVFAAAFCIARFASGRRHQLQPRRETGPRPPRLTMSKS